MRRAVLAACILSLAPFPASARLATFWGYGSKSCGTWTQEHASRSDDAFAEDSWLTGFVSAVNDYGTHPDIGKEQTDFAAMKQWVSNYCDKNPLDDISTAAEKMIAALWARMAPKKAK